MLKKIIAVFCCLLVFIPSAAVFAWGENKSITEITTSPKSPVGMEGEKEPGQDGKQSNTNSNKETYPVPPPKKSNNNNNSNEKSFYVDPKDVGLVLIRTEKIPVSKTTTTTEEKDVKEQTLYWEWRVTSGPGRMTVHSSNSSVKQVNSNLWRAGDRITASFDTIGDYVVTATQIKQVTTTITPITVTRTRYLVYKYYGYPSNKYSSSDLDDVDTISGAQPYTESFVEFSYETKREEKRGTPKVEQRLVTGAVKPYKVRVIEPNKPGPIPQEPENLQTNSRVIFSREYVYTDDIIDAITNKGFELEVIYDFTANTTIKSVSVPEHVITRYKNLGTMTIRPVEWKPVFYNGNKSVRIWARFKYPKAAVPGKSPMYFRVQVNTRDGVRTVGDQIDVPVNTLNGRFTDVPESETGELYSIKGLNKVNNREYLKDFGTITYHAVYVP